MRRAVNSLINEFLEQSVSLFPGGSVYPQTLVANNLNYIKSSMCVVCETHSECDTSAQTDRRRREIQTECLINNQHHLSDHAATGCFLTAHIIYMQNMR